MTETKPQNNKTYPLDNDFLLLCLKYYETKGSPFTYISPRDSKYITSFIEPNIQKFESIYKTNLASLTQINTVLESSENDFIFYHYTRSPYKQKAKERFDEVNKDNVDKMTFTSIGQSIDESNKWAENLYRRDSQFPEKFKKSRTKVLLTLQQKDAITFCSKDFGNESVTISNCDDAVTTYTTPTHNI